jgi:hypothetical protein
MLRQPSDAGNLAAQHQVNDLWSKTRSDENQRLDFAPAGFGPYGLFFAAYA